MQNTVNYNLKKPDLTDNVKISDINENMDAIDNELKNISTQSTTNESNITDLAGAGRTTETIKQNANNIDSLAGIGRTTETVKQNKDDISAL